MVTRLAVKRGFRLHPRSLTRLHVSGRLRKHSILRHTPRDRISCRVGSSRARTRTTVVQHGRSGVRDAKKNERSRLRSGASPRAPTVLEGIVHSYAPTPGLPRQALVSWPHGDRLSDASTPLAAFSRILLDGPHSLRGISEA